jgi:signal peptidase I
MHPDSTILQGRRSTAGARPRRAGMAAGRRLREVLLTAGAAAGLLCLLAAAAAMLFGITPVIFRSGSMAPAIDTGALALTRPVPVAEVRSGDVVSVFNSGGQRITHRVVEVVSAPPGATGQLVLKGDANALPDPQPYSAEKVDRVFFAVNGLGYPVAFLQTPWAIFAGGLIAGGLIFIAFRPVRKTPTATTGAPVLLLVPLAAFCFSGSGQATLAAFTDSSVATGGTLRSARLLDITGGIGCSEAFPNATITWNPAPFLPPEGSYALQIVRLKADGTTDTVMGYAGTAAGITTYTFTPAGALLGLLSGPTTFRINIFSVLVSGGGLVNSAGSNILWSSPVATVGNRTILNYPGILLGLAAHVGCNAN